MLPTYQNLELATEYKGKAGAYATVHPVVRISWTASNGKKLFADGPYDSSPFFLPFSMTPSPIIVPMSEIAALLYTRPGCHLCDDAKDLLERYGLTVQTVNIDEDPALIERFDTCVPVVFLDGKERFRGRVSEVLLQRLIGKAPPPKTKR